jgi:probable HAF family extracellular repeat protein
MYVVSVLPGLNNVVGSMAFGISANGHVAGSAELEIYGISQRMVGATWKEASLVASLPINTRPVEVQSWLMAVNSNARAVGWRSNSIVPISFESGIATDLRPFLARANDINDAGLICGSSQDKACIYDPGNTTTKMIDPLPGDTRGAAHVINQAGEVAGFSAREPGHGRAFFHDGTTSRDLGQDYEVRGLNDRRITCGTLHRPNGGAAICDAAESVPTVVTLPVPAGFTGGRANAINNHGLVVGGCSRNQGPDSAYLHVGGTSVDLNTLIADPDWHLESAQDINDAGQIVGYGQYKGDTSGFLLTPDPNVIRGSAGFDGRHTAPNRSGITVPELTGWLLGGVDVDLGGWLVGPAGPKPVDPWVPFMQLSEPKRDALLALAMDELAQFIGDEAARRKMRTALIDTARQRLGDHVELPTEDFVRRPTRRLELNRSRAIAEYVDRIRYRS